MPLFLSRRAAIPASEITDEAVFNQRRDFVKRAIAAGALTASPNLLAASKVDELLGKSEDSDDPLTDIKHATSYNNFYEFTTDKRLVKAYAKDFQTDPWSVKVEGACDKPGTYTLEDILKPHSIEERVYRFRCVEAWSMVVPWNGFALGDLLKRFQPSSDAKFVEFTTLYDPKRMPGQRSRSISWPYVEGLRIDEAMHPLAFMATGLYGKDLPPQNGAPIRLVVPWKYGFKSIKSIVKIRFTSEQPQTTWQQLAAHEYGFYANVNPKVSHPRWSQAREVRIPGLFKNHPTQLFNGYDEVASLYSGMDLRRNY